MTTEVERETSGSGTHSSGIWGTSAALRDAPALLRRRLFAALGTGAAALVTAGRGTTAFGQSHAAEPGVRKASIPSDGKSLPWVRTRTAPGSLIDDLVTGYHILFREGLVDAFGHISARDPENPQHYLMARSVPPPFVSPSDIVELDAASAPVVSDAPPVPYERFIHGEIYRQRPEVKAIVHSHAAAVLPFTVVKDVPLRAICHTCGFVDGGAPLFEIRDFSGDSTNMLVDTVPLGEALARTLGRQNLVLMRGHGFTVAGLSIQEAVYNAMNTVLNAQVQLGALQLGRPTYLSSGEAAAVSKLHDASLHGPWQIWSRRAAGELPSESTL